MEIQFLNTLENILKNSEFVNSIKKYKIKKESYLFNNKIRQLKSNEIEKLKDLGNFSDNWDLIYVTEDFIPDYIKENYFSGKCILGYFDGSKIKIKDNLELPNGIYRNTIIDSEIGNNCLVYNNGIISNYIINEKSIILKNDLIIAGKNNTFGNGNEVIVCLETGERKINVFAEINIELSKFIVLNKFKKEIYDIYYRFIDDYLRNISLEFGVIENNCYLINNKEIENSYFGISSYIENSLSIENSTILSNELQKTFIKDGAILKDTCIQWGSSISSMAIINNSVINENVTIEKHGKVSDSIIGANTHIAEGEITSCILGPFVGFHHQALLIAAFWPDGKGNVGYGANIGSNHTSKAPDQELWCGEGLFFGLGVNIKYPADFTNAPYSIIATGVNTLPQKVEMPFSLINKPSKYYENIPVNYNEIIPGWVLYDNIYFVYRNIDKFKKRNKAIREKFNLDIWREDIIEKVIKARNILSKVGGKKPIYTDQDIDGIGKNFLIEVNRIKAIETYDFYIKFYALKGLYNRVLYLYNNKEEISYSKIFESTEDNIWNHQKLIIQNEFLDKYSIIENLSEYVVIFENIIKNAILCKRKDYVRGAKIITDYEIVHESLDNDYIIKSLKEELEQIQKNVNDIITICK